MIRAQANELRQRRERYLFGDVFFNVSGYSALLPRSETAARRRFGATRAAIAVHEVMGQHDAERLAMSNRTAHRLASRRCYERPPHKRRASDGTRESGTRPSRVSVLARPRWPCRPMRGRGA